jgi:hypothetical protein
MLHRKLPSFDVDAMQPTSSRAGMIIDSRESMSDPALLVWPQARLTRPLPTRQSRKCPGRYSTPFSLGVGFRGAAASTDWPPFPAQSLFFQVSSGRKIPYNVTSGGRTKPRARASSAVCAAADCYIVPGNLNIPRLQCGIKSLTGQRTQH